MLKEYFARLDVDYDNLKRRCGYYSVPTNVFIQARVAFRNKKTWSRISFKEFVNEEMQKELRAARANSPERFTDYGFEG